MRSLGRATCPGEKNIGNYIRLQDMETCDPKGRDCIEDNAANTFNCSLSCEGFYADVQWVEDIQNNQEEFLAEDELDIRTTSMSQVIREELIRTRLKYKALNREIQMMKESISKRGNELDSQLYEKLISEYKQFKKNQVQHFRFDATARFAGYSGN